VIHNWITGLGRIDEMANRQELNPNFSPTNPYRDQNPYYEGPVTIAKNAPLEEARPPGAVVGQGRDLIPPAPDWPIGPALQAVIDSIINPHPDVGIPDTFHLQVVWTAASAMPAVTLACAPASDERLMAWLWPIADAVEYTPSEGDFMRRFQALQLAAKTVPGVVWTEETQIKAMRAFAKFPSVAAILDLVEPYGADWLKAKGALEYIARMGVESAMQGK
jgi:hypothetical protein